PCGRGRSRSVAQASGEGFLSAHSNSRRDTPHPPRISRCAATSPTRGEVKPDASLTDAFHVCRKTRTNGPRDNARFHFVVGNAMRVVVAGLVVAGLVSAGVGGAVWMMSSAAPPEKVQTAEQAPAPAAPAAPVAQLAAKADPLADITGTVPAAEPKPATAPAKRACAN